MSYVREQKVNGKSYFYFIKNVRLKDGKWRQFKKYLGKALPSAGNLESIKLEFEKEILAQTKSKYVYLENHLVQFVDKINKHFWEEYRQLNPSEKHDFDRNFLIVFTYNTNSIEGSTLTLKETYKLLEENVAPRKEYEDIVETKAAEKCLLFIKEYAGTFNEDLLLKLHKMYFQESKPYIAGQYKTKENRVFKAKFKTTPPRLVPTDIRLLFQEYEKNKQKMHPIELAAWAHWKIEAIHPFQDGNGRTGRLIMNFLLANNGYAMIDIKTKNKQAYYHALEKSDKQFNAEPLARHLVRKFTQQYKNALT